MSNFNPFNAQQSLGLTTNDPLTQTSQSLIPHNFNVTPNLDETGHTLPASKVQDFRIGEPRRNLIHWFVPQFGIVKMYVNPRSIVITDRKLIHKDKTKGGYTVQYFGEELTTIRLTGTTGSSGIEGINVLHEIYRAEQYAFDTIGLSLAADNATLGATNQILDGIGGAVANTVGQSVGNQTVGGIVGASIVNGIFGADNAGTFAPRNIPSLAQFAFGVEMYYFGWIYRGFFESMTVTESSDNIGAIEYSIDFTATQRKGYRVNQFPWNRSAIDGASNNNLDGGIPLSYLRLR